jgi:ligand-binding sensor protein
LDELIKAGFLQEIMDYFYQLTGIPVGIVDIFGKVLVKKGWQEICLNFHRIHPQTCRNCVESDCEITGESV